MLSTVLRRFNAADRPVRIVLVILLSADLILVLLFAAHKLRWLADPALHLGTDRGYAEVLQNAKLLWVGLVLAWAARRGSRPVYVVLAVLALTLLLDDALMLHERWGDWLAAGLGLPAVGGLRAADLGELLFLAACVAPIGAAGLAAYPRSAPEARRVAWIALGGIALFAGFGVGVDVLHQVVVGLVASVGPGEINGLDSAFVLVEDGGEMVVLSLLTAGASALLLRPAARVSAPPSLPRGSWSRAPGPRSTFRNRTSLSARSLAHRPTSHD